MNGLHTQERDGDLPEPRNGVSPEPLRARGPHTPCGTLEGRDKGLGLRAEESGHIHTKWGLQGKLLALGGEWVRKVLSEMFVTGGQALPRV